MYADSSECNKFLTTLFSVVEMNVVVTLDYGCTTFCREENLVNFWGFGLVCFPACQSIVSFNAEMLFFSKQNLVFKQ